MPFAVIMLCGLLVPLADALAEDPPAQLPERELDEATPKERAFAVLGAPLFSYDSNLGLGLGAYGQVVLTDPTGLRPFRANLAGQVYFTSGGYRSHYIKVDFPAMFRSPLRYSAKLRWSAWTQAPYYGVGNDNPRLPVFDPRDPRVGAVSASHYYYDRRRLSLRNDLRLRLTPSWELLFSQRWAREEVGVFPDSKLDLDQPDGVQGGDYAWVALGVVLDNRDSEVDPTEGVAGNLMLRAAHPWVGSDWTALGGNLELRLYKSLQPRLVSATFFTADAIWGERPFFEQARMVGLSRGVIGGRWKLRGLPEERFHGDGLVLAQQELRWTFWEPMVRRAFLRFQLTPFVDVGRVLDWDEEDDWWHLHYSGGLGLRLNLRDLIVLRADYGLGWEEFSDGERLTGQIYVLGEHPF